MKKRSIVGKDFIALSNRSLVVSEVNISGRIGR